MPYSSPERLKPTCQRRGERDPPQRLVEDALDDERCVWSIEMWTSRHAWKGHSRSRSLVLVIALLLSPSNLTI